MASEGSRRWPEASSPPGTPPLHPNESARLLSPSNTDASFIVAPSNSPPPSHPPSSSLHRPTRSYSTGSFVSSPLNPNPFSNGLPASAYNSASPSPTASFRQPRRPSSRGSMILYRLADEQVVPPRLPPSTRNSIISNADSDQFLPPPSGNNFHSSSSRGSYVSLHSDSKYPIYTTTSPSPSSPQPHVLYGALVAYEYDPELDQQGPPDEEDILHDPKSDLRQFKSWSFPWRGFFNIGLLVLLVLGLLSLFIFYPIFTYYRDLPINQAILGNTRINATGQAPELFQMPDLIDLATPDSAKTRTGYDGQPYDLVFSDEFERDGRTFYPGDDPFWEAVDLWYGSTQDLEWYDPAQITTRNGSLVITLDTTTTSQPNLTQASTAPFTVADNHNLTYRSGMLQSWNKFCFSSGYIEVAVTLPGPDQNTQGYWPGAWTMGNLGRPGYIASTAGMWPYTYDSCDIGTFPNQTLADRSGPSAALHSDMSQQKYNMELSWLPGQRLSACSCPNSIHPGPTFNKGRGAPEIDIFEVQKDKLNTLGQVASQSAQFAPFSHDYSYFNDTTDQFHVFDNATVRPNPFKGSGLQQAVSALAKLPEDIFQGSGDVYHTMGFEYWANPNNRDEGYITWQIDGKQTYRLGAGAMGPDSDTQISARLIPEEPMAIIFNLGLSQNWDSIDLSTMVFPAELKFDYVRVYQRRGQTNVGCSPKQYPTKTYIEDHKEAYINPNKTTWDWPIPKNSLLAGGC